MITHVTPVAVQRGKITDVVVEGQMNFHGVYKTLFEGTDIRAEIVGLAPSKSKAKDKAQVRSAKLKLTVAPDAALGVREFRVASSLGMSSLGQLLIVDDQVVQEKGDNNTAAKANALPELPCVACGRIEAAEDVDFFKFHAEAGQTITLEAHCARLQDKIHDLQKHADPLLTLYNAAGRELAANDDFRFADSLLHTTIPETGDYYAQIRDAKYDGDPRWVYALVVTNRPYVTHLFPMAGNPGQLVSVVPIGLGKGGGQRAVVQAPSQPGIHQVRLDLANGRSNPVAFVVSSLPQVVEQEPNDTPGHAMRLTLPCGVNGRIGTRGDLDHFVVAGKKGKSVRLEVKARRFGTPLCSSFDSMLEILTPKAAVLASNDDTNGKDAGLTFTPSADGDYVVRLRDLNNKGGETAVYYLEAEETVPDFTLRCDPDKAMIGPGSSMAWYVHVVRNNDFKGPVRVEVKDLPAGVSASPLMIPPSMTQGVVVLTAAKDAKIAANNVRVLGTGKVARVQGKEEALARDGTPGEEIYMPGGGRSVFAVRLQSVAVTEPSDILKVDVQPRTIDLQPGGEVKIDVSLQRRADFDKSVSLDILLRHLGGVFGNPLPPGVTIVENKSKTLLGTASKGHIVLKAAADAAPIDKAPISVMANVSINFVVKVSYSSEAILLNIKK